MIHLPLAAIASLALVGCAPIAKENAINLNDPDSWNVYLIGNWSCAGNVRPLAREDTFNLKFEIGHSLEITTKLSDKRNSEIGASVWILTNTSYELHPNRITFTADSHKIRYTEIFSGNEDDLVWTPTAEDLKFQTSTRYEIDVEALTYNSMTLRAPENISSEIVKPAPIEFLKCRNMVKL